MHTKQLIETLKSFIPIPSVHPSATVIFVTLPDPGDVNINRKLFEGSPREIYGVPQNGVDPVLE